MEIRNIFELMGTAGSLIMCASSVPQILKTYRMKSADNLSGTYLAVLMIGMSLILLYALHVQDIVFIMGNAISLTLTAILIGLRYKYNLDAKRTEILSITPQQEAMSQCYRKKGTGKRGRFYLIDKAGSF